MRGTEGPPSEIYKFLRIYRLGFVKLWRAGRFCRGYTSDVLLAMVMPFFWKIVVFPTRSGGYTWRQSPWFCRKKFNSLKFSQFFFCDFFSCRITCVRMATHAILPRAGDATIFKIIVSITKCSIVIGSPRAYLIRNRRVITWVSNYNWAAVQFELLVIG